MNTHDLLTKLTKLGFSLSAQEPNEYEVSYRAQSLMN